MCSVWFRSVPFTKGHTNREIGDRLFIAETTARNHVSRIFARLDMSRRTEAAAFAVQHGLKCDEFTSEPA